MSTATLYQFCLLASVLSGYLYAVKAGKSKKEKDVVIGNPILAGETLEASPRSFIFTEVAVPRGLMTSVSIFSTAPGQPIAFQLWRHVTGITYELTAEVSHVTRTYGVEKIDLAEKRQVLVTNELDMVGFTAESDRYPLAYNFDPFHEGALMKAHLVEHSLNITLYPVVGKEYKFGGDFFDKKFSIAWNIDVESAFCDINNGGCQQSCYQDEEVRQGACACSTGYTLDSDQVSCNDINECGNTTCASGEQCINTVGSYVCLSRHTPGGAAVSEAKNAVSIGRSMLLGFITWMVLLTALVVALSVAFLCRVSPCRKRNGERHTDDCSQVDIVNSWTMAIDGYDNDTEMHV